MLRCALQKTDETASIHNALLIAYTSVIQMAQGGTKIYLKKKEDPQIRNLLGLLVRTFVQPGASTCFMMSEVL